MTVVQMIFLASSIASFVTTIATGHSIAEDVNGKMGTDYKGVFVRKGDPWKEHERLFPASRKRIALAVALAASVGFLMLGAVSGSWLR
jgi:hypothetical protein